MNNFWKNVNIGDPGECWDWQGGTVTGGYGHCSFEGSLWRSHRVAYKIAHGIDPGEKHVLHRCDRPACCNPAHLFLGDPAINAADRNRKGRQPKGESHGMAKLTADQVARIRAMHAAGGIKQVDMSRQFGINPTQISRIVRGKRWVNQQPTVDE